MLCVKCGYYRDDPEESVCINCGRSIKNKFTQAAIVLFCAAALGLFSHYILTGAPFGGSRTSWVRMALTAPNSIYESPPYEVTAILTIAGLTVITVLAGFHYGAAMGLFTGFAAGAFSGVHLGALVFPAFGMLASVRRSRLLPAAAWPVVSSVLAVVYYVRLVARFGPEDALYRAGIYRLVLTAGGAATAAVAACAVYAVIRKYRSAHVALLALVLAAAPAGIFFWQIGPAAFQARRLSALFDESRLFNATLPEGFVTGLAGTDNWFLRPGRQLGNVFDTAKYVDAMRLRAVASCDTYIAKYRNAGDVADVLFLKASMYNALVDFATLTKLGRLETYFDRINPESLPVYAEIAVRFPGTPQGALGRYYLAEGTFQAGRTLESLKLFALAIADIAPLVPVDYYPADPKRPASVSDLYETEAMRREAILAKLYGALVNARRREALIADNSDFGGLPLARFAGLDERSEGYEKDLLDLIKSYPDSKMADNIMLILAKRIGGPAERAAELQALMSKYRGSDVMDEMLFEYAQAEYHANLAGDGAQKAIPVLAALIEGYPESTYAGEAKRLLDRLSLQAGGGT